MSEKENQSSENEENLPIENESIIELVEETFDGLNADATYRINREDFGVPESEEDGKKFLLKIKEEIIQKIRALFGNSKSFEQQRKKYRLEVIKSAENYTLYTIFGELKKDERKKIVFLNKDDVDIKDFDSFEKEVYFDIVKNRIEYHMLLFVLRDQFGDGLEESFPSKLVYLLKEYGWHLFKSHLSNDDEDPEYLDELHEMISDYDHEIDIEKKFLTQFLDEEFRELFELGHKKDWVCNN